MNSDEITTVPDLYRLAYVPGCWRCPKCEFVLTKQTLCVANGEVGTTPKDRQSEECPNDGTWMVPLTYKESLESSDKRVFEEIEKNEALRGERDEARRELAKIEKSRKAIRDSFGCKRDGLGCPCDCPYCRKDLDALTECASEYELKMTAAESLSTRLREGIETFIKQRGVHKGPHTFPTCIEGHIVNGAGCLQCEQAYIAAETELDELLKSCGFSAAQEGAK